MSYRQWKVGDKDGNGVTITHIYAMTPDFIIYATESGDPLWACDKPELASMAQQITPELERLKILMHREPKLQKTATGHLVQALNLCGYGKIQEAKSILEGVEKRFLKLRTIAGRLHYLLSCMILVLFSVFVSILLASLSSVQEEFVFVFYVATCGSLGGFLSVSLNLDQLEIDPDAPWSLNVISGTSRILIAMIGAIFVYFLLKADIILGIVNQSESTFAVFAISLVAGFSETFVPNILRKIESE